ncbi:hypothetical protein D0Z07_8515 [Hyphodiscus hymeniophilus]|uniref:Uncharacterized protein n=1 Tax=Hyphodiscus hymeniophilus TaxID=353542 RepID=A0A9P6VDA7_9HELO|nr:hypothetical protein D0Z07_8515 [Hyphodiscus hymeniophilus]
MSSLSSLSRCSKVSLPLRSFSTTSSLSAIGPENPKFIEIPLPPQRYAAPKRDIKGKLPPPRNVFRTRGPDKATPEYVAAATLEPSDRHSKEPPNDFVAWKRRMAASRRENLREGLLELHKRKVGQQTAIETRSRMKSKRREALVYAPQREDERLTSTTVRQAVRQVQKGRVPDPGREERVAVAAERVKAKNIAREVQRKDALHTLYMHAREFITTEEQLHAEIEKVFVEFPFGPEHVGKTNIWDAYGAPPSVRNMLSTVNNTQKSAMDYHRGHGFITGKRMTKIAEELTGGKMD